MPLFSVIVPVFNRGHLLGATLRSIATQTMDDFELIVIDDGSTDRIDDALRSYEGPIRIYRHATNLGLPAARNTAIEHASGDYLAFLDSDDVWLPWTLETFAEALKLHARPAFVVGTAVAVSAEDQSAECQRLQFRSSFFKDYLTYRNDRPDWWFNASMAVLRGDVVRNAGGFWSHRTYCEDIDFWQRIGTAPGFVRIASPCICGYRIHPHSMSRVSPTVLEGIERMIAEERRGAYPGGLERRLDRLHVICCHARHHARELMESGDRRSAWQLYRSSLLWNLRLMRLKFITGFPLWALLRTAHRNV